MPATTETRVNPISAPRGTSDVDFEAAVEAAKLRSLYQFAYGLSHEINNPLANIATRAQTLLADEADPERRRKLATIVQQAFRAHEMIADLMLFARPPAMRPEKTDLVKLADTVIAEMREQAAQQQTPLRRSDDGGPVMGTVDPVQVAVALKALVQNALEALRTGGNVEVSVECKAVTPQAEMGFRVQAADFKFDPPHPPIPDPNLKSEIRNPKSASCLYLTVTDDGPGISAEARAHIFDPFFCGREAGRGLGLGLSKAWRIVEMHGGQIQVVSEPGRGATFTIALPLGAD